jgi:hypothetical protein
LHPAVVSAQGNVLHVNFVAASTDNAVGSAEAQVTAEQIGAAVAIVEANAVLSAVLEAESHASAIIEVFAVSAEVSVYAA